MKHINFYQKYRPRQFSDILEQEETITILKNVVAQNKTNHAYLFTGMQGVGKTSTARIFAQAVNCLNNQLGELCQECVICRQNQGLFQDIIEIDAASHSGVEEIRNLKANAIIKPATAQHKVYIVDEVHMLSKAAFNAFLKILEEPPRHIVFILATTEITKIPETVLSRCQIFYFHPITVVGLTRFLSTVARKELLEFDQEAVQAIANHTQGLVRDSLNLLEQIASSSIGQKITLTTVCKYLGLLNDHLRKTFLQKLLNGEHKEVFQLIENFAKSNVNFQYLTEQLLVLCKELMVVQVTGKKTTSNFNQAVDTLDINSLKEIIDVLLEYHPRFQLRLQSQLLFEMMCMKILILLKKPSDSQYTEDRTTTAFSYQPKKVNMQEAENLLKNRQLSLFSSLKDQ